MKLRTGFVSNSSSSSFVCDITGAMESGYDASPRDCGFEQCTNGHTFVSDLLLPVTDFTLEKYAKMFVEENNSSKWRDELNLDIVIKFLVESNNGPVEDYDTFIELINEHYDEEYDSYEVSPFRCPICMMHEVSTDMLMTYLVKASGKDRKGLTNDIRKKYKGDNKAFEAEMNKK